MGLVLDRCKGPQVWIFVINLINLGPKLQIISTWVQRKAFVVQLLGQPMADYDWLKPRGP